MHLLGEMRSIVFVLVCGLLAALAVMAMAGGSTAAMSSSITNMMTTTDDSAEEAVVQSDGRIVVAGTSGPDIAVVRYNADGSLDTGFGTDGIVTTDISGKDRGDAVALQSDGKILVGGSSQGLSGSASDFAVVRYNTDGSLDTGFGTGGIVTTDIFDASLNLRDEAHAISVQSNGKIVVVGWSNDNISTPERYYFAIVRLNTDGSFDTSFGSDGIVTVDAGQRRNIGELHFGYAVALQVLGGEEKIVVAGQMATVRGGSDSAEIAIVRLNSDGTLDTGFDTDGKVLLRISPDLIDKDRAFAVVTDGTKLVVAGAASVNLALVRLNSDGSLDTSFGEGDGKVTFAGYRGVDVALANGKIVVVGEQSRDFSALRYNSDGSLDTSFGTGGIAKTDIGDVETTDNAHGMALQSDGKIVVVGKSADDFAVLRYNSDGSLDTSFGGGDGKTTTDLATTPSTTPSTTTSVATITRPTTTSGTMITSTASTVPEPTLQEPALQEPTALHPLPTTASSSSGESGQTVDQVSAVETEEPDFSAVEIQGDDFSAVGAEAVFTFSGVSDPHSVRWDVTGPERFAIDTATEQLSFAPPTGGTYTVAVTVTVTNTNREMRALTDTVTLAVFGDLADSQFIDEIVWLAQEGITTGCGSDPLRYCPGDPVTRGQMASFLVRALDLEAAEQVSGFADVDSDSVHASDIEALFAAQITTGCGSDPLRYCPGDPVTRGQMASFLVRALGLEAAEQVSGFADVDSESVHASDIEALFAARITTGCGSDPLRYCPGDPVTRGQMAAFLYRSRELIAAANAST